MIPIYKTLSAAFAAIILALPAYAEDLAVILSTVGYRSQPDLATGPAVDRMERALEKAGFSTVTFNNQRRSSLATRLDELSGRIGNAERLVIIANGHLVHDARGVWMLGPQSGRPTVYDVGAMAVPIGPLIDAAGKKPGAGVVILMDQPRAASVSTGVTAGAGDFEAPQGVTVLAGRAGPMTRFVEQVLTVPGLPIGGALRDHDDVRATGFVSEQVSFLTGGGEIFEPVETIEEPVLSRKEILAGVERDLGLSRSDRRRVQQSLAILSFNPGGIDGVLGRGSRRAIRSWQGDNGFEQSGFLNRGQHELLLEQGEMRAARLEEEAREKQADQDARDTAYWRDMGSGDSEAGLRAYLKRYPDGLYSERARDTLGAIEAARRPPVSRREQSDWDKVSDVDTPKAYRAYLKAYPEGAFASEAKTRLEELEANKFSESEIRNFEAEERRVAGAAITRKLVENRLTTLGLEPGLVDGVFDDDARKALRRFQTARGLDVTGYVDQATLVRVLLGN